MGNLPEEPEEAVVVMSQIWQPGDSPNWIAYMQAAWVTWAYIFFSICSERPDDLQAVKVDCLQHSPANRFGLAIFPGACPFATFETAVKSECSPSMTQPKNKEKEQQEQPVIDGLKTDVNVRT